MNYKILAQRTQDFWKFKWGCEIVDLEEGYLMARFYSAEDYNHVLERRAWIILAYYLIDVKWRPRFFPVKDKISSSLVWLRFPGLPMELYDEETDEKRKHHWHSYQSG